MPWFWKESVLIVFLTRYLSKCSSSPSLILPSKISGCAPALNIWQFSECVSVSIFRTGGLFKTLWNVDQSYSEPCHRALFSQIQTYSEPCATLAYSESWNIQNPSIIASRRIFRASSYLRKFENSQNSDILKT